PTPAPTRSPSPTPVRTSAAPTAPPEAAFVPLTPVRVLDTRFGTGGRSGKLGPGETYDLVLAGRNGVPAGATAVALNLTGTQVTSGTHLTVWPAGQPRPETAVLNLRPGGTAASLVVAGLGTGGATSVRNLAGEVSLVADVVGYWTRSSGALYHPVQPARLLDTRTTADGARRIADQETRTLQVRGAGGVPSAATAVALNVTSVGPQQSGFVTVTPSGAQGTTSSVNYAAGETVPNRVITGLSSGGAVDLFVAGSTHVLVDVVGWYGPSTSPGGSAYTALTPSRLVDSRDGTGTPRGAFGPKTTRDVQATGVRGVPAGATAVVLSLTGTSPTASQTFVAAFPDGTALPGTSDLNLVRGETRSNLAIVPLSAAGKLSLYNEGGSTDVIADVLGYYAR
ncbi:MAG: N-acetylmuramoyl-L-alanine amidase, partial [Frankiales bacterium]|nr:N-acetylmuramoyl-L-alanine amidase [Frankiales bacterium]